MRVERRIEQQIGDYTVRHEWSIESDSQEQIEEWADDVERRIKVIVDETVSPKEPTGS